MLIVRGTAGDNAFEAEVAAAVRAAWGRPELADKVAYLYTNLLIPHSHERMPNEHDVVLLTEFGALTIDAKGLEPGRYEGGPNENLKWVRKGSRGSPRRCPEHLARPYEVAFKKAKIIRSHFLKLRMLNRSLEFAGCVVVPNHADLSGMRGRQWSNDQMHLGVLRLEELADFLILLEAHCKLRPHTRRKIGTQLARVDRKLTKTSGPAEIEAFNLRFQSTVSTKLVPVRSQAWEAQHTEYDQRAFVKVFSKYPWIETSGPFFRQLKKRVKVLREVRHPNIIRLRNDWIGPDCVVLEYEYFDAPSLKERVDSLGPLPLKASVDIALGAADAIDHLHRVEPGKLHALHRALDSTAILLRPDLSDFRLVNFSNLTIVQGSTVPRDYLPSAFLPPEMSYETHPAKRRATVDVYSIGRLLAYMLTGDDGLGADGVAVLLKRGVPEPVARVVEIATAGAPTERYATAAELREALRNV